MGTGECLPKIGISQHISPRSVQHFVCLHWLHSSPGASVAIQPGAGPCSRRAHLLRHLRMLRTVLKVLKSPSTTNAVAALLQGKGEGRLRLIATYWPFDLLYSKPREATMVLALP